MSKITLNGVDYAGGSSGSGDSVSWTQVQQSGAKIAEIDINGTSQDVYAPSGGGGSSIDYSTAEETVGSWIDSKPLYQLTFSGSGSNSIDISALNVDTFCGVDSGGTFVTRADTNEILFLNYTNPASAGYSWAIVISSDKRTLNIAKNAFNIGNYAITIRYTKTTD